MIRCSSLLPSHLPYTLFSFFFSFFCKTVDMASNYFVLFLTFDLCIYDIVGGLLGWFESFWIWVFVMLWSLFGYWEWGETVTVRDHKIGCPQKRDLCAFKSISLFDKWCRVVTYFLYKKIKAKNTFSSLHFHTIPTLVPIFYFYRF